MNATLILAAKIVICPSKLGVLEALPKLNSSRAFSLEIFQTCDNGLISEMRASLCRGWVSRGLAKLNFNILKMSERMAPVSVSLIIKF